MARGAVLQEKVAVGEAVKAGYRFGFGRLGAVIGMSWLPCALAVAATAAVSLISTFVAMKTSILGPHSMATVSVAGFALMPLNLLIEVVFGSMATIGVISVAFGRREPSGVYLSFGRPVLRLIAANAIAMIAMLTIVAAVLVAFAAAAHLMGFAVPLQNMSLAGWFLMPLRDLMMCAVMPRFCPAPAEVAIGLALLLFAGLAALVYVMVRLTYFLPAVVLWEERVRLARSWKLSGGNFWRIFAVSMATMLPTVIGIGIAEHFASMLLPHGPASSSAAETLMALQGMPALLIVKKLLTTVSDILTTGLECGASAKAYLQLTMADAPDVF